MTGHLAHFWQRCHPRWTVVSRDGNLFHGYTWLQCIWSSSLSRSTTANLSADSSHVTLSSFFLGFLSSSKQFPHAQELSQCLWCSALYGTQELLISSQRKVEKGFYFHSESLIFITWRTMSCIIKTREPDRQFSPFLKNMLCCFLVFKHNHKISNL